ncbi:MAG: aspartyl-tRNA(Asn)/glutamyl-tRNA(Gln) amidotransferase subunit A [Cyclobacteriaceae bacterium]
MLSNTPYLKIRKALDEGELSCAQLLDHYLTNIHNKNPELNALLSVYEEEAKVRAQVIDEKLKLGTAGKLAGLVVSIKDVLCYKNHPLSMGSKILENFESQFSATCVERLLAEDAIIIGRNNCDEFAMGSSSENSAYGVVRNADDTNRVPGGSSGGSAVSVQADMCAVSLGTDTGGSVRQPASFCGIVGFKPTYSRISRYGLASYASSFDAIGIFANSVEDTALVLEIIAGEDDFDSTVSQKPVENYSKFEKNIGEYTIATFNEAYEHGMQHEVKEHVQSLLEGLKTQHKVESIDFPLLNYALATYYILTTAEASSNLSRYDGVKFGHRVANPKDLEDMYKRSRTEGFGKEVLKRILLGTFVLSASYLDAFYTKAQKSRRMIKQEMEKIFEKSDFIILPTAPTTAFELNAKTQDPLEMYLADLLTVPASIGGFPAISIPIGKDKNGMSIGLQIVANTFEETKLLSFAKSIQDKLNA